MGLHISDVMPPFFLQSSIDFKHLNSNMFVEDDMCLCVFLPQASVWVVPEINKIPFLQVPEEEHEEHEDMLGQADHSKNKAEAWKQVPTTNC